jgi:hypothetical protein
MGYEDCCVCGKTFSDTVQAAYCKACDSIVCRSRHCRQAVKKYERVQDNCDADFCLASCPNCDEKTREENKEERKVAQTKVLALMKSFSAMELLALKEIISEGLDCEGRGYGCDYDSEEDYDEDEQENEELTDDEDDGTEEKKEKKTESEEDTDSDDEESEEQRYIRELNEACKQADVQRQVAYELYLQQNRT